MNAKCLQVIFSTDCFSSQLCGVFILLKRKIKIEIMIIHVFMKGSGRGNADKPNEVSLALKLR